MYALAFNQQIKTKYTLKYFSLIFENFFLNTNFYVFQVSVFVTFLNT